MSCLTHLFLHIMLCILNPLLDHLVYRLCCPCEVPLHEQRWPIQGIAHLILPLLPVKHILDLISNRIVGLVHVLPFGEWELGQGNLILDQVIQVLPESQRTVRVELGGENMNSCLIAVVLQVD